MTSTTPTLYFLSINPSPEHPTILFIHSGFSSHREFHYVTPHLLNHHLLIPDLPSHGRSTSASIPFSPTDTAALLADLIATEALTGRAHVVGVSMGGYIALYLAAKYPDRVLNLFVSGCDRELHMSGLGKYAAATMMAVIYPTMVFCISSMPQNWFKVFYGYLGLQVPEGLQEDQWAAVSYRLGGSLAKAMMNNEFPPELLETVKARTLVVAAVLDDGVAGTSTVGVGLRKGNLESRAAKVEGMRHIWSLQNGELFAKALEMWLTEGRVVQELEVLRVMLSVPSRQL